MKPWWAVAFGVLCGFLGAGILVLVTSPPRGPAIILLPAPTRAPLVVHVTGAVARPGVYTLPHGSRSLDAIEAAGGFLPDAQSSSLNLAAFLTDGERILVGVRPVPTPTHSISTNINQAIPTLSPSAQGAQPAVPPGLININTANQVELESLPGIGPALAGRIIAYREQLGPFMKLEDIQKVSGIGPAIFSNIKDLITLETYP